ncbi:MAG: SDR family NAD(P)-dependent oxidoreductase, partial [Anaerolineales bacterium]|nr:SDR family NAD(P)-dependent oxidoreductase [Anaerolineales bacterium]
MRLKNKTILITGAAQRIGRSLALSIAHEGGDVIIHHNRSKSEAESLQQEIKDLGQVAHIAQADFSDSGSLIEFTRQVFSTYKIFAVVNNASIFTDLNWSDTNLEDWELHQ